MPHIAWNETDQGGIHVEWETSKLYPHTGSVLGDYWEIKKATKDQMLIVPSDIMSRVRKESAFQALDRLKIPDTDWPAPRYITFEMFERD